MNFICVSNYIPKGENELLLLKDQAIKVIQKNEDGWWYGYDVSENQGWFPSTYVRPSKVVLNRQREDALGTAIVTRNYNSRTEFELDLHKHDQLIVLEEYINWVLCSKDGDKKGMAPKNHLELNLTNLNSKKKKNLKKKLLICLDLKL